MPSLEQMVSRQIERWERQGREAQRSGGAQGEQQPVITISRAYGSRGREVGRLVAERLGFDLYDKELVERVADSAQVRQQVVETLDSRVRDQISRWLVSQFDSGTFTSSEYLDHLSRVLVTLGQHGKAVIVGRGAHRVLESRQTLRVRVTAPLEERIAHVAEAAGLEPAEARARVLKVDAEREAYARHHFNASIGDAEQYDIVLNTGALPLETCAKIIETSFVDRFVEGEGAAVVAATKVATQ